MRTMHIPIGLVATLFACMAVAAGVAQTALDSGPATVFVPPAAPPSASSPPAPVPQAVQATEETALAFARSSLPPGSFSQIAEPLLRDSIRKDFASDPYYQTLERTRPGVLTEAENAGITAMRLAYAEQLPQIQRRLATFVRPLVREVDLRAINAFMDTQIFNSFIGVIRSVDDRTHARDLTVADRQTLSSDAQPSLSEAQLHEWMRFARSPAGQALFPLAWGSANFVRDEADTLATTAGPEVQAAIVAVMRQPMDGKPR